MTEADTETQAGMKTEIKTETEIDRHVVSERDR